VAPDCSSRQAQEAKLFLGYWDQTFSDDCFGGDLTPAGSLVVEMKRSQAVLTAVCKAIGRDADKYIGRSLNLKLSLTSRREELLSESMDP